MADLVVLTPTRGRPRQFAELAAAVRGTAAGDVALIGYVDDDDPAVDAYLKLAGGHVHVLVGPRQTLSGWTNVGARTALAAPERPRYLASLGDDHRPRTPGWDRHLIAAIEEHLDGPGIAYGNDLFQGPRLPTSWVVSAEVVDAVGWVMLPTCEHLFVDTAVLALGQAAERVAYCPSVIIEHLHPLAGKGEWDDSYKRSNAAARYAADEAAYEAWVGGQLAADVAAVRALHWTPTPTGGST